MFMNDVNKKDLVRNVAIQDLRELGIKYRPKKHKHVQDNRIGRRIFKTALHLLPMQTVTLINGQQLVVPKIMHDLCSFILTKVETEGLFRKGGSKSRQNEIKLSLDAGCGLGDSHHEIDVANILKTLFRELPEPLFPFYYHDYFLRCTILTDNQLQALLLTCLLLPSEHLNTLAYFMQFLNQVCQFSNVNKMNSYNLAVVIAPTIFPTDEKLVQSSTHRLTKICHLFQMLIENASNIGVIPEEIIDRLITSGSSVSSICDEDVISIKTKKKRRSASLTRMFSGLRKMVGGKSGEDGSSALVIVTPDLLATPSLTKSAKKRKLEANGFSNKKKYELLKHLPNGMALGTPISVHPNPKKISPSKSTHKSSNLTTKDKRSQWNLSSRRNKPKQAQDAISTKSGTKAILEKRWSAVSQAAGFRRKKCRHSLPEETNQIILSDKLPSSECDTISESKSTPEPETDYVKISRSEYEEIKNRVSAIEQHISSELENFGKVELPDNSEENADVIVNVQSAYEKTLNEAEPLSLTTDQLARRLSKDLKIRCSVEQKIIRSPSARKIGSMRRRSRERERLQSKVQRNQSWHVENYEASRNLKRGQPNTVLSGLPTPKLLKAEECTKGSQNLLESRTLNFMYDNATPSMTRSCQRSASYNGSKNSSGFISEKWTSAEGFFRQMKTPNSFSDLANCRASIARLRNQNAGMVMAKARLFDGLIDSDNSLESQNSTNTNVKAPRKIGQPRNIIKSCNRAKSFRCDENISNHPSPLSPKKKNLKYYRNSYDSNSFNSLSSLDEKENKVVNENSLNVTGSTEKVPVVALKDCNRIDLKISPYYMRSKRMPHIKKSLNLKSPKRLCRTPLGPENKQTPLKVVSSTKLIF